MSVLICGSLAYDTIMVFPQRFKDHILADQTHILNVSFLVPRMHRNFGGCAGNIAYTLKKLGGEPLPVATVGADFEDYASHLDALDIDLRYVRRLDDHWTAQAYITTDVDDNQITAFHPGAMEMNHLNRIQADADFKLGIVAPDGKRAMLEHSERFAEIGIPHVFDPGQGLPMFDADELKALIERADWLTVNSYEWEMLSRKTGWGEVEAVRRLSGGLIITHGGDGSQLITMNGEIRIEAVPPEAVEDPTGCGDAYRAGLLYGLERGWDPADACRLGSVMGSIKIAHRGPQRHPVEPDKVRQRFMEAYGRPMPD